MHTLRIPQLRLLITLLGLTALFLSADTTLLPVTARRAAAPLFATITVNSNLDGAPANNGQCTLREAIINANNNNQSGSTDCAAGMAGLDNITFNLGAGTPSIAVTGSALPTITDPVSINGNTGTATRLELNGAAAGAGADGLNITAGGSTIQALVINRFTDDGIEISGAGGNVIIGSFIGTDAGGTMDLGNGGEGVHISSSSGNRVGGTTAAERNVISGNGGDGVEIDNDAAVPAAPNNNSVLGNYIGVPVNGNAVLANDANGVAVLAGSNNVVGGTTAVTIGGPCTGACNVLSGNSFTGISIRSSATFTLVIGNFIGANAAGTGAVANAFDGIFINGAQNSFIGGTTAAERNLISGNGGEGIEINGPTTTGHRVVGNFIGTDVNGTADLGNGGNGVLILGAPNNTIGGTAAGAGNIISGNEDDGVQIGSDATGNLVQGNFIGTNAAGTADLGNSFNGVQIRNGANNNTIGGTSGGARNVISGNSSNGVLITGTGTTANLVQGNYIGTTLTGAAALGSDQSGVRIEVGATNNTIGGTAAGARNVISANSTGIFFFGAGTTGNLVQGNYIGTDLTGTMDLGNVFNGVEINNGVTGNTIGGTTAGAGNVISGNNNHGVSMSLGMLGMPVMGNLVQGNLIGTDVTGTVDLGNNFDGVNLGQGAGNNTIGGTTAAARNVISGNGRYGVSLIGSGVTGNLVQGNFIGTDGNGTADLGNSSDGVSIAAGLATNTIGGTTPGAGNRIFGNGGDGVNVDGGNTVGMSILGNSIFNNDDEGIDLLQGPTPNDPLDPDTGPNNVQNYPVLSCVQSGNGTTTVAGTLNSLPNTSFRLEFFASPVCDAGGFGEGQTFLGFQNVTTNASGDATFSASFAILVAGGQVATATATRLDAMGNPVETSEFSACRTVVAVSPTVAINDVTVTEGNTGTTNAVFTITLSNAVGACLPITVNYATQDGTATGPGDFTPTASFITFNPPFASNTLTQQITVPVVGDFAFELDETFFVNIAAVGAAVTDAQGQGTILNDDTPIGPGLSFPEAAEVSDQKAGSVLVYNLYSSSAASPNTQNTRFSITNVQPVANIAVHLFFVDGATCSIADAIICLTKNQTASFLASDLDPGTTGYLVAVASDPTTGCPINFNFLVGDAYMKLASGHAANLGAEAFAALPGGPVACDGNALTATLNFDGVSYNRAPRTVAASSIPARNDGNDTLLVVNRFGGNLATGAGTLTDLLGLFYDDAENGLSFTFSPGTCQFRSSLSGSFPRTTPRLDSFIPAGRTGWLRLYSVSDLGLLGAVLNYNPNAGTSAGAFNQGRNLHKLTLTSTQTLVIPIFPPNCLN